MPSPLIVCPDRVVALAPRLFAPAAYYAALAAYDHAVVDTGTRYDKRAKSVHRYDIADVRGPLALTVPVVRPHGVDGTPTWADARVSRHGNWWHVHRVTLESAYGRTPFFEFVIDRFDSLLADPGDGPVSVIDYCRRADEAVRDFLHIDTQVEWRPVGHDEPIADMRRSDFGVVGMPPYYQVRQDSLGFMPGLSILDLIFNIGDEAPYYLQRLQHEITFA